MTRLHAPLRREQRTGYENDAGGGLFHRRDTLWTAAGFEKKYRLEDVRLPGFLPGTPEMRRMMIQ